MISYGMKSELLKAGFGESKPWSTFEHQCGLIISVDDHEWQIEHDEQGWSESGSLNDTSSMWQIINKYISK